MSSVTETSEQQTVIEWCEWNSGRHPELDLIYHIPNEGKRSSFKGAELRSIGLKAGVPDLCLPVPKGDYHALYIEMKKDNKSRVRAEQKKWLENLNNQNNLAVVCRSADEAIKVLEKYLNL